MSASLLHPFSVVLLDIEGTTTPVDFVYEVLFPYARDGVRDFLKEHKADAREETEGLREENRKDTERGLNPPAIVDSSESAMVDSLTLYAHWLMDADRKSTPLKSLQGKIWEEGYRAGLLLAQVFEDVPRAFQKWKDAKKAICIYSSGSALAQRLLFAHTEAGDLTPMIDRYFDTNIGAKIEMESYRRIASALERKASEIVFISDVTAELDAARAAGFQTLLSIRPGNRPQPNAASFTAIHSFDEVFG
ncbi:MAG: acireductone synthase [Acidobacteriota bacterium]